MLPASLRKVRANRLLPTNFLKLCSGVRSLDRTQRIRAARPVRNHLHTKRAKIV